VSVPARGKSSGLTKASPDLEDRTDQEDRKRNAAEDGREDIPVDVGVVRCCDDEQEHRQNHGDPAQQS